MRALDLFAGPGGWEHAARTIGMEVHGVENDKHTLATRAAEHFPTIGFDIWPFVETTDHLPGYDVVIASPPCPTFSMTGSGKGRRALTDVIALIDSGAYRNHDLLHRFGEHNDPRTALTVLPLDVIERQYPEFVVLEQVPPVLPVWEKYAERLRQIGYSAVTGILNAVEFGVPQDRKRAVLIARRDGVEARMPTTTHSRYHRTDPLRLDPGKLPWVSIREALGWGIGIVGLPRLDDGRDEGIEIDGEVYRIRDLRDIRKPSLTVTGKSRSWRLYTPNDRFSHAAWRAEWQPAPTVTGGHDSNNRRIVFEGDSRRVTVDEVAALQGFPAGTRFSGPISQQYLQVANAVPPPMAKAILQTLTERTA